LLTEPSKCSGEVLWLEVWPLSVQHWYRRRPEVPFGTQPIRKWGWWRARSWVLPVAPATSGHRPGITPFPETRVLASEKSRITPAPTRQKGF
jgi:hypothetical protein